MTNTTNIRTNHRLLETSSFGLHAFFPLQGCRNRSGVSQQRLLQQWFLLAETTDLKGEAKSLTLFKPFIELLNTQAVEWRLTHRLVMNEGFQYPQWSDTNSRLCDLGDSKINRPTNLPNLWVQNQAEKMLLLWLSFAVDPLQQLSQIENLPSLITQFKTFWLNQSVDYVKECTVAVTDNEYHRQSLEAANLCRNLSLWQRFSARQATPRTVEPLQPSRSVISLSRRATAPSPNVFPFYHRDHQATRRNLPISKHGTVTHLMKWRAAKQSLIEPEPNSSLTATADMRQPNLPPPNYVKKLTHQEVAERDTLQHRLISLALEPWVNNEALKRAIACLEWTTEKQQI